MPTEAASVGLFEWLPASTALTPLGLPTEASRHLDGSSECFAASAGQECRDLRVISVVRLCSLSEFGVPADVTVLPHFGCSFEFCSQNTAGASAEGERGRSTEFRVLPSLFLLFLFVCLFSFDGCLYSVVPKVHSETHNKVTKSHARGRGIGISNADPTRWARHCSPSRAGGNSWPACRHGYARRVHQLVVALQNTSGVASPLACGILSSFLSPTSTRQAFQLPARVDAFLFFHCFVGVAFSLYWYKSQL